MMVLASFHHGPFDGTVLCVDEPKRRLAVIRGYAVWKEGRYVVGSDEVDVDDAGVARVDYWWVSSGPTSLS